MSTHTAPTPEPTPAENPSLSPKVIAEIKAYVSFENKYAIERGQKLKSIESQLSKEAIDKSLTQKQLNSLLILAGMEASIASKLATLAAPPKNDDVAAEMEKLNAHNAAQGGKRGNIIGFDEKLKVKRGDKTVAEILQAKEEKQTGKRAARPQGNAPATPAATPAAKYDSATIAAKMDILMSNALAGGMSYEEFAEARDLASNMQDDAHEKKEQAKK